MSLLLLFKSRWFGPNARKLGYSRAVRVAARAKQLTEKRRESRKLWEEPVRAFLASVERGAVKPGPKPAAKTRRGPIVIRPEMVATLAHVFRPNRERVSLAAIEALLDGVLLRAELAERQRKAAALELLSALMAYRALDQAAQDDDTLMLMALAAAV